MPRFLLILALRILMFFITLPLRIVWPGFFRIPPSVMNLPMDDPGMKAAMDRARSTLPELIRRLGAPPAGQTELSVKVPLPTNDGNVEHVWMAQLRREGEEIVGVLGNEPRGVSGKRIGDEVRVRPNGISDWMAVENGVLVGGYTVRYLRSLMSRKQRETFDQGLPFRIEDADTGLAAAS